MKPVCYAIAGAASVRESPTCGSTNRRAAQASPSASEAHADVRDGVSGALIRDRRRAWIIAVPPKEFPATTENNSLVPAAQRFVHAAQAATNQEHPCVRPRTPSRISLINSLMQGICVRDGFAGDCFHREQV